jgi:(p)ppGpp synthase/HD superfamily hydrolase
MVTLDGVLSAFRMAWPGSDVRMIENAYAVAAQWHDDQRRRSGDPYITHPVAVAMILAELGFRKEVVCAALMHDLLEDTAYSLSQLRATFGAEVADLVVGVTELDDDVVMQDAVRRWTASATARAPVSRDILVLKLADRLHNMRTVRYLPPVKQRLKAQQTAHVLVPLAALLGMDKIQHELADLASRVLYPDHHGGKTRTAAHRTLEVAALLLPNRARARWLEEWAGELAVLSTRRRRMTFVAQIVYGMPRLAITLRNFRSDRSR